MDIATRPLENAEAFEETASEEEEDKLIGCVLDGRYQIIRRLGAGGMGAVYEAENLRQGKRVAVKVLQSSLSSTEKYRKRFLREAKAASAIPSDYIVRAMDFGIVEDGPLYFTMELLEGMDLEQFLKDRAQVRWAELEPLFVQILHAVGAAHAHGIVHRDIKPSNCFLCTAADGSTLVKVLDFGIAKVSATGEDGDNPIATVETLTATNELFGTVAYMAPELIEGHPADARSDIYALGVMLFRALTGALPFTGANAYKVLQQHVHAPVPSLRSRVPEAPAAVESVVFRAMAKQPEHRYQSIGELQRALAAASRGVLEPSAAALAGYTEAVHPALPAPVTDPSLDGWTSRSGPFVASYIDDPGSLRPIPTRSSRLVPVAVLALVLVVSAGTAAIVGTMVSPGAPASAADPRPPGVVSPTPREPTVVDDEALPAPSTRVPVLEPRATLPAVEPDSHAGDLATVDTVAELPAPAQPIIEPPPQPPPTSPAKRRAEEGKPVKAKAKPASLESLAGQRCPDARGERFVVDGLLDSRGKYFNPSVSGGSKPTRDCIKAFIQSRRFGEGASTRKTLELIPR